MDELSEEELLAYELAEEDLEFAEAEVDEWREYDEQVRQVQELGLLSENGKLAKTAPPLALRGQASALDAEDAGSQPELGLDPTSAMEAALRKAIPAAIEAAWSPSAQRSGPSFTLPGEYRARLVEGEGVVVSQSLGPHTVVLLSRVPDQPELLPVVSDTFRAQKVKILRGWLEASGAVVMDAFEVCDSRTGEPLPAEDAHRLESALVQALRAPAARAVLFEIDEQLPRLEAFFGLPADGSRPPSLTAVRGALLDSPFRVSEARDLGRVLAFRGELQLPGGGPGDRAALAVEALAECRRRLDKVSEPECRGRWDCFLMNGYSGQLLLVLPIQDLEATLAPPFEQRLVFMLSLGITMIYAQAAAPEVQADISWLSPPVGALVFSVVGAAELARRAAAERCGARIGLPLLLPSPAVGTFGACSRALSPLPNAVARFDIASNAVGAALGASFTLIVLGLLMPPGEQHCAWVNPNVFPHFLRGLVVGNAEIHRALCVDRPMIAGPGYVPADPVLIAGCFGALTTALNSLPLGRLDGSSVVTALPWGELWDVGLPYAAMALLGTAIFTSDADGLFPLVLAFSVFTFGVRPLLAPEPVLRDNVSQPEDLPRQVASLAITLVAFALLLPAGVVEGAAALAQAVASLFNAGG